MTNLRKTLTIAALGLITLAAPAAAEILWSSGCVAWDSVNGCTTMQTCWVNTGTGKYACTNTTAQT